MLEYIHIQTCTACDGYELYVCPLSWTAGGGIHIQTCTECDGYELYVIPLSWAAGVGSPQVVHDEQSLVVSVLGCPRGYLGRGTTPRILDSFQRVPVLARFWRISLYVTDDAAAKRYVT